MDKKQKYGEDRTTGLGRKRREQIEMPESNAKALKFQTGVRGGGDRYLMFYAQSTAKPKGHIRVKQNVSKILIHYLKVKHIPPLKIWMNLEKMNLNEPGRKKLGKQAQHPKLYNV